MRGMKMSSVPCQVKRSPSGNPSDVSFGSGVSSWLAGSGTITRTYPLFAMVMATLNVYSKQLCKVTGDTKARLALYTIFSLKSLFYMCTEKLAFLPVKFCCKDI
ncbi:hypothetical protein PoB_007667100 [Plakobranchus ocellatus]|uniref:Uncharacterized protein n=1 Tax=Plakobranchus ocellatus TaxID=259542 RepID=A0AAV4E1E8_9GAST|nr:hypothetical protein PoB_007667100 [Plakobranchus ocellatus]